MRIDYDKIAHLYDEPLRDHAVDDRLVAFAAGRPDARRTLRVLDIGCGTGKQLAANRVAFPQAQLIGVDRSRQMLRVAARRCASVAWLQADAVALPLVSRSVDYATSQYSYQHVARTASFLAEVVRVLTPGGRFVMTNIDPWAMPGWLVYRYFPGAWERDQRDFLRVEEFSALMELAGFSGVEVSRTDLSRDERLRDFLGYASARHRASQLTAISDAEYEQGLARLREECERERGAAVERSQFVRVVITGVR